MSTLSYGKFATTYMYISEATFSSVRVPLVCWFLETRLWGRVVLRVCRTVSYPLTTRTIQEAKQKNKPVYIAPPAPPQPPDTVATATYIPGTYFFLYTVGCAVFLFAQTYLSMSQLRHGRHRRNESAVCPWSADKATGPAEPLPRKSLHRLHEPRYMNNSVPAHTKNSAP